MDHLSVIYANHNPLSKIFKEGLHGKIIMLSDNKWPNEKVIKMSSVQMIPKLKDKLTRAVVFITSERDIKNAKHLVYKTSQDNARLLLIIKASDYKLIEKVPKDYLAHHLSSLLIVGEVFGPKFSTSKESKIFQKATETGEFEVSFDKEQQVALVSQSALEDLVPTVLDDSDKIVLVFYEDPQTMQGVAMEYLKKNPEIKISYGQNPHVSEVSQKKIIQLSTVHFEKSPNYPTLSKFKDSIEYVKVPQKFGVKKEKIKLHKKIEKSKKPVSLVLTSLIVFFILLTLISGLGAASMYRAYAAIKIYNLPEAIQALDTANKFLSLTNPLGTSLLVYVPVGNDLKSVLANSEKTTVLLKNTLSQLDNAFRYQNLQNTQSAIADLTYAYFKLSALTANGDTENVLGVKTSKIASILQSFPEITGTTEEKNYLILFQNNSELRPSGGFIGSVGELKMKDGKIAELKVRDVYELDGQLKIHVEPHYIIRRYLQPHLYLRDSNFDIDFEDSAHVAAQIYNAETGNKIDGVIALDLEVIKRLLDNTGKIKIPGQDLEIDSKTAQSLIQDKIQDDFYPGSDQKKAILQGLMTTLILRLQDDPKLAASFAREVPELLDEKHIQVTFRDENIQKLFAANDYTGSINDTRAGDNLSRNDIFGINEANIGVNKANESLERRVEYESFIGQNSIISKATLTIFNTGASPEDYRAFVRFITPKSSELEAVDIDNTEQKIVPAITDPTIFETRNYKPPTGLEVEEKEEDEYKTFGFVINVPKNTTQKVALLYTNGVEQRPQDKINYSLMFVKQSGTTDYPFKYTLRFPNTMTPVNAEQTLAGEVSIVETIKGDNIFTTTLTKK